MALGLSLSPVDVLSCEFHRLVPVGARQAVAAPPSPPNSLGDTCLAPVWSLDFSAAQIW